MFEKRETEQWFFFSESIYVWKTLKLWPNLRRLMWEFLPLLPRICDATGQSKISVRSNMLAWKSAKLVQFPINLAGQNQWMYVIRVFTSEIPCEMNNETGIPLAQTYVITPLTFVQCRPSMFMRRQNWIRLKRSVELGRPAHMRSQQNFECTQFVNHRLKRFQPIFIVELLNFDWLLREWTNMWIHCFMHRMRSGKYLLIKSKLRFICRCFVFWSIASDFSNAPIVSKCRRTAAQCTNGNSSSIGWCRRMLPQVSENASNFVCWWN